MGVTASIKVDKLFKEEKEMKKWQITLTAVCGSFMVLFAVGYIMCNFIY